MAILDPFGVAVVLPIETELLPAFAPYPTAMPQLVVAIELLPIVLSSTGIVM